MWIRVRVDFSLETTAIFNLINEHKENLKKIHAENILLKKLCFFGGDIQSEAQKKLNKNAFSIECEENAIKIHNQTFCNRYENDYKTSYNKAVKDYESFMSKRGKTDIPSHPSTHKTSKPVDPIVYRLNDILHKAKQTSVSFGITLDKKIQERIAKLN